MAWGCWWFWKSKPGAHQARRSVSLIRDCPPSLCHPGLAAALCPAWEDDTRLRLALLWAQYTLRYHHLSGHLPWRARPRQAELCGRVLSLAAPSLSGLSLRQLFHYLLLVAYRAEDRVGQTQYMRSICLSGPGLSQRIRKQRAWGHTGEAGKLLYTAQSTGGGTVWSGSYCESREVNLLKNYLLVSIYHMEGPLGIHHQNSIPS